jgi:hypothetical protein
MRAGEYTVGLKKRERILEKASVLNFGASILWERYVEYKLDCKTPEVELRKEMEQAGEDIQRLRKWLGNQKERQAVIEYKRAKYFDKPLRARRARLSDFHWMGASSLRSSQ